MSSVPRSVSSSSQFEYPRSVFKRTAKDASVPASGVTAAEFVGPSLRQRTSVSASNSPSSSSVPLRSVASVYGISPKDVLRRAFLKIKRAATAEKFRCIAERLANLSQRSSASRLGFREQTSRRAEVGKPVTSRRLQ